MSATPRFALVASAALIALALAGCHNLDFSPRYAEGEIDIFDDLFSVSVPDPEHAVAVGYHGAAYYTSDGGGTWSKGDTPTTLSLYSVSMADAKHGWAVGQLGTILRTEDGGATWTFQPNLKHDEGSHLFGVHAIDPDTAWVVGVWGTRIRTRDGGVTWEDHSLTVDQLHPMFVWLSIPEQEKVRSGGKVYEDVGLNDVYCLDPPLKSCWIVGEFGYIFHSPDQGETWIRSEILGEIRMDPVPFEYNKIELKDADRERIEAFAEEIADENHLNIRIDPFASPKEIQRFGNPEDPTELFDILEARMAEVRVVLEEAGILTDRLRMPNKPPWDFEDFVADDPTFLQRYLEGRTAETPMIRVGVIQNPYLFDIHFKDAESGLIAGLGGVVLRSRDGGLTWRYHITDRKQALFSVAGVDGRAIAVGEKGLVRFSDDGGSHWRAPKESEFPTIFTFMRDMAFDDHRNLGLIVGQTGMVLRSEDGGASWTQVLPPADRRRAGA
jgi:photosystem II stability/assembly factor-like uncharacterized protein